MRLIDLTGQVFNRLTVLYQIENKHGRTYWHCRCECGNEKDISGKELKNGNVQSCGCLQKELARKRMLTHGETETRLYYIWTSMKQRCENPTKEKHKKDYQDRGIKVCAEWHKYEIFRDWAIKNGYTNTLSIDRIDNNGNYEPSNCRWTTAKEQANNKRTNVRITYNGITKTIAQWAEDLGIGFSVLHNRIKYLGWSVERAITTPIIKRRAA